ncbi:hypothetical protein U1Q18_012271 [Sarracenia purpurea var. burkii]
MAIVCGVFLQAAGGYWYILSIQRIASCLSSQAQRCNTSENNRILLPLCSSEVVYRRAFAAPCGGDPTKMAATPPCLDGNGPFSYGIYQFALPLVKTDSVVVKVLYSNLWGLMALR